MFYSYFLSVRASVVFYACNSERKQANVEQVESKTDCHPQGGRSALIVGSSAQKSDSETSLDSTIDKNHSEDVKSVVTPNSIDGTPEGMVLIKGGMFNMGAVGNLTLPREYPRHPVTVSSFYMDTHEVTNAEFKAFVEATGYVTIAERPIDWEELKKQVPPGTPKPPEESLRPGSLLFKLRPGVTDLTNYFQWWGLDRWNQLETS